MCRSLVASRSCALGRLALLMTTLGLMVLVSCKDSTTAPTDDGGGGGGGNPTLGSLSVTVTGLPTSLDAAIDIVSAADSFRVTATTTLDSLNPGFYDITALDVIDPVLPVAWEPSLSVSQITVVAGETASFTVAYDSVSTLIHLELRTADGYNGVSAEWNGGKVQPVFNGARFVSDPCGSGWAGGFSIAKDVGQVHADTMSSVIDVDFRAAIPDTRTIAMTWNGSVSPPITQGSANARVTFNELPYNYFYGDLFNPRGDSLLVSIEGSAVLNAHTPVGGTPNVARTGATASVDVRDCADPVFFVELYRLSSQVSGDSLSATKSTTFRTSAKRLLFRIHLSATLIGSNDSVNGYQYTADGSGRLMISVNKITP